MRTGIGEIIDGAANAIDFVNDPWGRLFKVLRDAASGLAKELLPALTTATLPDLSADWFLRAYAIAFAAAIFVAVVLLIPLFVRTARGAMAGRDLAQAVMIYFPVFLITAMFGPAFGRLLVEFFHALSDAIAQWGIVGSAEESLTQLQTSIDRNDGTAVAGGIFVSILLMLGTIVALILVLIVLVVQLLTLYFTGVVMALGLVWLIDPQYRRFGQKIPMLWLGLLASHPLLFFLLGVAFRMTAATTGLFNQSPSLQALVQGIVSILAMIAAAISPLLLMKFAPVMPTAAAAAAGGVSAAGIIGAPTLTSWMSRNDDSSTRAGSTGDGDGPTSTTSTVSESSESTSSTSTLASSDSVSAVAGGPGALTGTDSGEGAGSAMPSAGPAGGRHSAPETLLGASSPAGASGADEAVTGAAGAGEAVAAGGGAAEAAAAAGAAESSTGVGAVIGVPTLLAAGAMKAGEAGLQAGLVATEKAAEMVDENGEPA
ncbi:hypothetical protein [Rathayibacter sp. Leaf299]|uniref:hypothetical protein n=1 Tax=Rathayibacter sp. Leaf299 TaxID=1736328 RepID=UPI000ACC7DB8|nr:hypothetical protein [Rathayibacter sp. Leaf299]